MEETQSTLDVKYIEIINILQDYSIQYEKSEDRIADFHSRYFAQKSNRIPEHTQIQSYQEDIKELPTQTKHTKFNTLIKREISQNLTR